MEGDRKIEMLKESPSREGGRSWFASFPSSALANQARGAEQAATHGAVRYDLPRFRGQRGGGGRAVGAKPSECPQLTLTLRRQAPG